MSNVEKGCLSPVDLDEQLPLFTGVWGVTPHERPSPLNQGSHEGVAGG